MAVAVVLLRLMANLQASEIPDDPATAELVDLLVSDRPEEQAKGENMLAAQRSSLIAAHLQLILSPDAATSGKAAYRLGVLISPWLRGVEASQRSYMLAPIFILRRPVEKVSQLAEAPVIRQSLQTAIGALLTRMTDESAQTSPKDIALVVFCETLGEVANDDTMAWTINQLQQIKSPSLATPLIKLAESYLNIPETPEAASFDEELVTNTPTEAEKVRLDRESLYVAFRAKLVTAWQELRPMGSNERIAFAIKAWWSYLLPHPEEAPGLPFCCPYEWIRIERLIRLGAPAVAALRIQQRLETNLTMKGIWEVAIAGITGREDTELVNTLFRSEVLDEELVACTIIAADASKQWLPELERLQSSHLAVARHATTAIALCHGCEGIPALKKGGKADRWDYLQELEARAKSGPPKGMSPSRFP